MLVGTRPGLRMYIQGTEVKGKALMLQLKLHEAHMFFFQYFGALLRHSSKSDKIKRLKFILFYANKYNLVFLVRKEKYDRFFLIKLQ